MRSSPETPKTARRGWNEPPTAHGRRPRSAARRATAHLLVLGLLLSPGTLPLPAAAQTPAGPTRTTGGGSGPTITAIDVEGLRGLTEETLLFYLGLAEGERLDESQLDANIKDLWSRQLLEDITVETRPDEGGVRVLVTVEERPVLRSIEYEGFKKVDRTEIQDRVVSENIQVLERTPLSRGELERLKRAIGELYEEKGYRFADVDYRLEEVAPNEFRVAFTVDEGDRVRIADIDFVGNDVLRDLRLKWAMKGTKESGLITRLFKKDVFNPAKLEEDLENVRELYRRKGYKNVEVGEPEIDVRAMKPNAPPGKQKRRLFLEIPIDEGERWRIGEVTIEGNEEYSDQQLLRFFEQRPGRWLQSKKLDKTLEQINELYHNTGFILARVDRELVEREGNVADVVVHVDEFERYDVGRIEFEGNTRTKDKVLRREIRLREGLLMNAGALRSSVLRINQLQYFQLDEQEPLTTELDSEEKEVDITFHGQEADRFEVQFGGGWSETFGFEGNFALRTRNFMGRGETLAVNFQQGRFRDVFDFSYFVPWLFDRPQTVGIRLFDQDFEVPFGDDDFDQEAKGIVLTYGRNLTLFQQLSLSFSLADREDTFTSRFLNPDDPEFDLIRIGRESVVLSPSWLWNRIDNRFQPTRGFRVRADIDFAGGFLGGDSELVRPEVGFTLFKPIARTPVLSIFGINVEGGWVDFLGGEPLSPSERFRLGGENSIRGHRVGSIFVRNDDGTPRFDPDFNNRFFLAGDVFLQANLEYHFALGGPIRLIAFVDAGNVWAEDDFDPLDLRSTAGLEMRVLIPVFGAPLRFIYAFNLDPLPGDLGPNQGDDFEDFQFSFGTTF